MFFIEFSEAGELIRFGTDNGAEKPILTNSKLITVEELPADVKNVYYDFDSDSILSYTLEQRTEKDKGSPLTGVWSNKTMQWTFYKDPGTEWEKVKILRNTLLKESDWTQLPDVPLATKEVWAIYRQALRDITLQSDPFNIIWPEPPQ